MSTYTIEGDIFEFDLCPTCGVKHGVPKRIIDSARDRPKGTKSWYCPNGHSIAFVESDADKLRRERDQLKQNEARLEEEAVAAKREVERLRKRIGRGVCPCCRRHFVNVARHMKTKHPEIVTRKRPA